MKLNTLLMKLNTYVRAGGEECT